MDQHRVSRIAVIAVHGVGDQGPNTTARDVAGLLQRANPDHYSEFSESQIELPVRKPAESGLADIEGPVRARRQRHAGAQRPRWYVRSRYARLRSAMGAEGDAGAKVANAAIKSEQEPDDIAFTRRALEDVEVDDRLSRYRSVKLSGVRSHGQSRAQVDIYELYWADLSRLGGWFLRVLAEFYQILFHVTSLGQKTVELAWVNEPRERKRLRPVLVGYAMSEWALAVALPVFNLAMLFAVLPVLIVAAPDDATVRALLCGVLAAAIIAFVGFRRLWSWAKHAHPAGGQVALQATIVLGLAIVGGTAMGYVALDQTARWPSVVLQAAFSLASFALFWWLVMKLATRRRLPPQSAGAVVEDEAVSAPVLFGVVASAVWLGVLGYGLATAPSEVVANMMRLGEALFLLVEGAWIGFILTAWLTVAAGFVAGRITRSQKVKDALWTGYIGLVVPASLLFVINLIAWRVLAYMLTKVVADRGYEAWLCAPAATVHGCIERLIDTAAGGGFNFFLALTLVSMLLLIVGMIHSIVHESRPSVGNEPAASAALGEWLSGGFILVGIAARVMLVAVLFVVPLFWVLGVLGKVPDYAFFRPTLLSVLGGIVITTAGIAVALRAAIFEGLSKGFDIAFDVDNWLKERPVAKTPRGRILLRYLALLEHVRAGNYQRVVIVTHSQGTVITADLLRYLCAMRQAPASVTLMTFGSPLRQLYGLRFPHLYGWARGDSISAAIPDRAALSVHRWINAYRSGDYVGRFFWTAEQPWRPRHGLPAGSGPLSFEFCVGAGAHTHYFDETATIVGAVIDLELA